MILSTLVIAGTLGAGTLGLSVKAYQEQKRKKEYPWTVAAEAKKKLALLRGKPKSRFAAPGGLIDSVTFSNQEGASPIDGLHGTADRALCGQQP